MTFLSYKKKITIGIIRTSSIGDVVLATSCLSLLSQLKQNARVIWIGRSPSISIIKDSYPEIDTIDIKNDTHYSQIISKLKEVDLLLDLQGNIRSRLISYFFKLKFKRHFLTLNNHSIYRSYLIFKSFLTKRKINPSIYNSKKVPIENTRQFHFMTKTLYNLLSINLTSKEMSSLSIKYAKPKLMPTSQSNSLTQNIKN